MVPDEGIYREKTWHWIPKMVRIPHFKWLKFSIRKNYSARYPDSSFSVSFTQFFLDIYSKPEFCAQNGGKPGILVSGDHKNLYIYSGEG